MNLKRLFVAVSPALLVLGIGVANAGQTVNEEGVLACVNDKWDEKEVDKGHKLVDYAGRCMTIPSDPAAEKVPLDCVGKYEYMPDGSWKGSGTCTDTRKDGKSIHGKRVRTSRSTLTKSAAAPTNTKVLVAAARTSTTI